MGNTIPESKELESLRRELTYNGFGVGESNFSNTIYAINQTGKFKNGLPKMAIEYWVESEAFLMMGRFYKTEAAIISFLKNSFDYEDSEVEPI